jgi:hypothetical protein
MLRSTIKIIDFGFAIQLTQNNLATSILGSPINMDPAILKQMASKGKRIGQIGYDQKADIWSLGTICYELLIGQAVFNAETMNELVRKVEAGTYSVPTSVSKEMVSFLNGMLQYKGEDRLSSDELYKHPFLTKNIRDFTKIDTRRVQRKINKDGLNINVKKNQTIWGIFNEDDEKRLLNINAKYTGAAPLQPIPEYPYPQDTKRRNSDFHIPRNPMNNPNVNKNYIKSHTNYYNNYPFPNNSIYGQNMSPNQPPGMPQYPNFNQIPPFSPPTQPPSQAYSSGMGGYSQLTNYPTFAPAPYTFASNIYQNNPPLPVYPSNYATPPPVVQPPPPPSRAYTYSAPMNNDEGDNKSCIIM